LGPEVVAVLNATIELRILIEAPASKIPPLSSPASLLAIIVKEMFIVSLLKIAPPTVMGI